MKIGKEKVKEWAKWLTVAPTTKKQYLCQVGLFLRLYTFDISPQNIEDFLLRGATTRTYIRKSAITSFLRFLNGLELLHIEDYESTLKRIKYKVKERRDLQTGTFKEVEFLVENIPNEKLRLIVEIAFDTGARIQSILRLRKKDIKKIDKQAFLFFRGKGEKTELKPITPETYRNISQFVQKAKNEYIFLNTNRCSMKIIENEYIQLWSQLKKVSRKVLGIGWSFHWLRRTAAVYWYNRTKSIRAVQEFLNHESPETTSRYLKLSGNIIRQEYPKEHRAW